MVKGNSRQVIVLHSPDPKLFDQAIFILKEDAVGNGITDELLLKEAQKALRSPVQRSSKRKLYLYGPVWACGGALVMGILWLITSFI